MLDIHQCEIFVQVTELKSFSKAAQRMYLTQPTVSQHISALENHLGARLFDRLGKEVALTRAGEVLYGYAKQITALRVKALQALDLLMGKKSGDLILGASTIPGEYILPQQLGQFKTLYPAIRITIRIGDTGEIIDELLARKIEMGIVGAKIVNPRLQFKAFVEDELILVVPKGHRWWKRASIALDELNQEPFIMREAGSGTRLSMEKHLHDHGISADSLHIIAEVGSTTAVKQAIKARLGISLISERAVGEELKLGIFRKIAIRNVRLPRTFFIIQDRKQTPSPLCAALLQFLASAR
jgi:DNA-binding transcriptional LysR family regulator